MNLKYQIIKEKFEEIGLCQNDFLRGDILKKGLDNLIKNKGSDEIQQFDNEIFNEIWQECKQNSEGQVLLRQFMLNISNGIRLTIQKQAKYINELTNLTTIKNGLQEQYRRGQNKKQFIKKFRQINQKIKQFQQLKNLEKINLDLLVKPFIQKTIIKSQLINNQMQPLAKSRTQQYQQFNLTKYNSTQQQEQHLQLLSLLYLLGLSLVLQITIMFLKNSFLNLIVLAFISLIFINDYLEVLFLNILFIMIGISQGLDLIWIILYSNNWWMHRNNSEYSIWTLDYQRWCIICSIILIIIRFMVVFILNQCRNMTYQKNNEINIRLISKLGVKLQFNKKQKNLICQTIKNQFRLQ